jgi:hypothetical protein
VSHRIRNRRIRNPRIRNRRGRASESTSRTHRALQLHGPSSGRTPARCSDTDRSGTLDYAELKTVLGKAHGTNRRLPVSKPSKGQHSDALGESHVAGQVRDALLHRMKRVIDTFVSLTWRLHDGYMAVTRMKRVIDTFVSLSGRAPPSTRGEALPVATNAINALSLDCPSSPISTHPFTAHHCITPVSAHPAQSPPETPSAPSQHEWDEDHSNTISYKEFKKAMATLGITLASEVCNAT